MKRFLLSLSILLAACSGAGSTGPKPLAGVDPAILVINHADTTLVLTWWDQSGKTQTFIVPRGVTQCTSFTSTSPSDSVRFLALYGDTLPGHGWFKLGPSPWFDPETGAATSFQYGKFWTMNGGGNNISGWSIISSETTTPCI